MWNSEWTTSKYGKNRLNIVSGHIYNSVLTKSDWTLSIYNKKNENSALSLKDCIFSPMIKIPVYYDAVY